MLTKYFSTACDPINPACHTPAYLLASVVSPGILISPGRLASILSSRFGGPSTAFKTKQLGAGVFEFIVASSDIASEIALRGWVRSGCILISINLKRGSSVAFSANSPQKLSSQKENAIQRRQVGSAKTESKVDLNSKTARRYAWIACSSGSKGTANGYGANRQSNEDLVSQRRRVVTPRFPQHAGSLTNAVQSSKLASDRGMQRVHASSERSLPCTHLDATSFPFSYKSALLAKPLSSPQLKLSHHVYPRKPKDLHRRCYRCLSYSHFVTSCRDPVVCRFCRASGHLKKTCPFASQFAHQAKIRKSPPIDSLLEPAILGRHTSLDVHCPPARDLNSLVTAVTVEPAATPITKRTLLQYADPQTKTLLLDGFTGHTQHASVSFERGAYHVRLELSPCRVIETWIPVAPVNHQEEPTFPCFDILTGSISKETYRSLLFNLLLDSEDGPVLDLLPAVIYRYKINPALLVKPIAAEVNPLSIAPLSQCSALLPHSSLLSIVSQQASIIMPSPPICIMPPTMLPPLAKILPISPRGSPVAVMPLVSNQCVRVILPLPQLNEATEDKRNNKDTSAFAKEHRTDSPNNKTPTLLQLLPPYEHSIDMIPDLNVAPPQNELQVYVRRSLRIQKVYDGDRINPVERASRRVAAAVPRSSVNSASSTSSGGSHRRCRPRKERKIGDIIQLPLKEKPKPTSRAMVRELAGLCGLKGKETIKEAARIEKDKLGSGSHNNA